MSTYNGLSYSLSSDDVFFFLIELGKSLESKIIGLSGAGGEDNFLWVSVDEIGNLDSGVLDCCFGLPAVLVRLGMWISEHVGHEREHGVKDSKIELRGGLSVEIDATRLLCINTEVDIDL
jgi:hypothetical protein